MFARQQRAPLYLQLIPHYPGNKISLGDLNNLSKPAS
jgi:hypothetical protein